jgi:large subunit ribosomal protein L10
MTKENKQVEIADLKELLQDVKVLYVADLKGLNAANTSEFRRQAFKDNIKVRVVKNTLLKIVLDEIEGTDFSEMYSTFKGNSAVLVAETANAPAKLIQAFRKKSDKPVLKSAFVQETVYVGDQNITTLANIKSREEMIGDIIGLLQSPLKNVLSALQNKDEASAPEAAAEATEAPAEA